MLAFTSLRSEFDCLVPINSNWLYEMFDLNYVFYVEKEICPSVQAEIPSSTMLFEFWSMFALQFLRFSHLTCFIFSRSQFKSFRWRTLQGCYYDCRCQICWCVSDCVGSVKGEWAQRAAKPDVAQTICRRCGWEVGKLHHRECQGSQCTVQDLQHNPHVAR